MKTGKTWLSLLLVTALAFSLCAFGGAAAYADGEHPAEAAQTYNMFAMGYAGQIIETAQMGATSVLTLNADGSGTMSMDADLMEVTAWTVSGNTLTVTLADGSAGAGALHLDKGVIELDFGGYIFYYGREGADTAFFLSPDTRLHAVYESIDPAAGAHLKYALHTDYLNADSLYDVHTKGDVFYSADTVQVNGYESTSATFYQDGKVYSLKPADRTGMLATRVDPSMLAGNILAMDTLYSAILSHALRTDYTTETREEDGVTYTVDCYPATAYQAEGAFFFDGEGKLVRYVEGPPVIETTIDIGESVYTIESIDTAVDESLLDISGYQITQ